MSTTTRSRSFRRRARLALLVALGLLGVAVAAGLAAEPVEPLQGLDPVMLSEGKEVIGDESITFVRGPFRYSFASAETRDRFAADPERYEIQYGGGCARMITADGNPDLYAVYERRIYIFGSASCWKAFTESPESYVDRGEREPLPSAPAAAAAGREWIERAAAALGRARLDAMRSYRESGHFLYPSDDGEMTVPVRRTHRFPRSVRTDQTLPFGEVTVVTTPEAGFQATKYGVRDYVEYQRAYLERDLFREPALILRARDMPGFRAVHLGGDALDGRAIERVAVELDGERMTLGIEPASGLPVELSFRGRGPEDTLGRIEIRYADFREVDGLKIPFARRATFDGEPYPERSLTLDGAAVDPELEPGLFDRPAESAS